MAIKNHNSLVGKVAMPIANLATRCFKIEGENSSLSGKFRPLYKIKLKQ